MAGKVPPPGVGHRHLTENFSQLPENIENLKNGHVLYIYEEKASQSKADTGRELKANYFPSQKLSLSNYDRIRTLVNRTFNKFKNLSGNAIQFEDFTNVCNDTFIIHHVHAGGDISEQEVFQPETLSSVSPSHDPILGTSSQYLMVSPPVTTDPPPSIAEDSASALVTTTVSTKPQSSAMLTSSGAEKDLTARKVKLFVSKSRAELTKRYKDRMADLQEKLKVPQKYVNQNV